MGDISQNLSRYEFACKCGCGFDTVDYETAKIIQEVCDHFLTSVTITSGCRCRKYNLEIGGAKNSQHPKARAADCIFRNVKPEDVYTFLDKRYPDKYGFGDYNTFTHIDTRSGMARWKG